MNTRIERLPLSDLKLLKRNARYMTKETFDRLVANVKADGKLTSVPFACKDEDGSYLILSGNHRVQAAQAAGLEEIEVMVTDDSLTKDQRLAIQLSHNALAGQDDASLLKELAGEIESLDWKLYSAMDDKALGTLPQVDLSALTEVDLEYRTLVIYFLPPELERARALLDQAKSMMKADAGWLARMADWDRMLDTLADVGAAANISNRATQIMAFLDIAERHLCELCNWWEDDEDRSNSKWVPLSSLFGTRNIPPDAARVIKRAVDKMVSAGVVKQPHRWKALEYLAAEVLAS